VQAWTALDVGLARELATAEISAQRIVDTIETALGDV